MRRSNYKSRVIIKSLRAEKKFKW